MHRTTRTEGAEGWRLRSPSFSARTPNKHARESGKHRLTPMTVMPAASLKENFYEASCNRSVLHRDRRYCRPDRLRRRCEGSVRVVRIAWRSNLSEPDGAASDARRL